VMPATVAAARTPANVPVQSMVTDFKITNPPPPKSPASRQLIKPPELVCVRAWPNVRHGAAMVHALASLPERETHDRSLSACAGKALSRRSAFPTSDRQNQDTILFIVASTMLNGPARAGVAPCGLQG